MKLPDRLQSEEEFGEIVIRTNNDGRQVKIKHIAVVKLGVETYTSFTRLNEEVCSVIAVYQAPGTNAVEMSQNIRVVMEQISARFPEGIEYQISLDSTTAITAGIKEIIVTLFVALALVILVVFIFIQDWRATLIPTVAIPVSLVGAFILFPMLGFTVNVLSLLGLVLAIGIVVDDAIVVVEAVQVNIEKGMTAKEATNAAMQEVTAPIIATTLVLVAVFAPTAAMGGITGILYQQFAITVAVSVLFSSVNALSLSPALCSILMKKPVKYGGALGKFFGWFNRSFDRSADKYTGLTKVVAGKISRGIVFIVVIASGVFGALVPGGFIPEEDQGYIMVNVQLPDAASMQRADDVSRKIEDILASYEEIEYSTTVVGYSAISGSWSPNTSFFFISLTDWSERDRTALQMTEAINRDLFVNVREAQAFAFGPPAIPGLGTGSGFSIMLQDRVGSSPQFLAEQTQIFLDSARARSEIGSVFTPFQAGIPQKFLDIDREKALKLGVDLNDLYATIGAFLGGSYANDFNRFGRLYKTYVQAEPEYRRDPRNLDLFFVKNNLGKNVPLSTISTIRNVSGPEFTNRYNLYRATEITGAPAPGLSSNQALDAVEEVANRVLPPEMSYEWTNMSYQEKVAGGAGAVIFVFSLIFVYLILAAQYESWSLPWSILLGTPFAIFGALFILYIARLFSPTFENNIFAQISFVMLIAMAAKNAILIVEFAKLNFDSGMSLFDSAINSAKLRFRPILMTAASFILGVLPLVVASGSGAEARKVMGMALLGGMTLATVLGVFFYPMLFVFIGRMFGYEQKRDQAELAPNDESG